MLKHWMIGGALALVASIASAQALPEKYQAGVHYTVLPQAQAVSVPANKIEVVEVFSYMCIHCAHFQPHVDSWKKKQPAHAQLVYMPAAFNPTWEMAARFYYTAKAFGVVDKTHQATFDAIHNNPNPARDLDGLINQVAAAFQKNAGIAPDKFKSTLNSFAVNTEVDRAGKQVPRYKVEGTPEVIVAGKYRITGKSAGGFEKIFDVVNFLVDKEARAKGLGKAVAAPVKALVKPTTVSKPQAAKVH